MKNAIKLFGLIALVALIGFPTAACKGKGGGTTGGSGGTTGSSVTGPRYVFSLDVTGSGTTSLFTLKFTGDTISASGAGVAYREDFTTSTMAFIPGHNYNCAFTYTLSGDTVTITWPDSIYSLPDGEQFKNTPEGNAWAVAWDYTINMTGNFTGGPAPCMLTKTGSDLTASFTSQYGSSTTTNVWEYKN